MAVGGGMGSSHPYDPTGFSGPANPSDISIMPTKQQPALPGVIVSSAAVKSGAKYVVNELGIYAAPLPTASHVVIGAK